MNSWGGRGLNHLLLLFCKSVYMGEMEHLKGRVVTLTYFNVLILFTLSGWN